MGLKLRYNLFFGVDAEKVYREEVAFWTQAGGRVLEKPLPASPGQSA